MVSELVDDIEFSWTCLCHDMPSIQGFQDIV